MNKLIDNIADIFIEATNKAKIEIEKAKAEKPALTKSFLMSIDWKSYEAVCVEYLILKNCNAKQTNTGADKGIDIKITNSKNELTGIAQCKRWSSKIGVNLVREFFGVMTNEKLEKGIFFTTSTFTADSIDFCKDKKILLINGDELINQLDKLKEDDKAQILAVATRGDYMTPTCARCDKKMLKRTTKKGKNIGNQFWGCANFPRCRSTINFKM